MAKIIKDLDGIALVEEHVAANYPFSVQHHNGSSWSTACAFVTQAAALAHAKDSLSAKPKLPVRIEHATGGFKIVDQLPVYTVREALERPYDKALWTGFGEPPKVGDQVFINVNQLGPGVVTGYAVDGGYLGVMVLANAESRPDWHKRQNPENQPAMVFGSELRPTLKALYALWDKLSDVPVDEQGLLEADFLYFEAGKPREDVWRWFEARNPDFVVGDVMQGKRKPV